MRYLSVKEFAHLKGCSERSAKRWALAGDIPNILSCNDNNIPKYLIPLEALDATLQAKWYRQNGEELPPELRRVKRTKQPEKVKPLDAYSTEQREEITRWTKILAAWQTARNASSSKAEGDKVFLAVAAEHYPDVQLSAGILYRKWEAYRNQDWDGLVDKRGLWRRGTTESPQEIRDLFEYCYLDETALSVQKCVEATEIIIKRENPQMLTMMPSYRTFHRWAQQLPAPVVTLARQGDKAFNDKYGLFIDRLYDDMASNDFWIADGHRIDVITRSDDGKEHRRRLTLSAFIDARSGIYVGWVVTDNPSSDATLLALRKAIQRYGIPRYLYVDNGREYLTADIGGLGHRAKATQVKINLPTPILERLGITMCNALPRNAQAKIIEREFRNFTFLSQLFDTYCGSNVVAKPEKLKYMLKAGRIPTDGQLAQVVEDMIEGYFNMQIYNGKVVHDRGKNRLQVYQDNLHAVRKAAEDDLHLMMMRSTRMQTIGKNGVYITIGGERLYYFSDDLLMKQGQKVFVRYDPEVLNEVRVYDDREVYMLTVTLRTDMMQTYVANKEEISAAMATKRRWRKMAKQEADIRRESVVAQYGHINMLDVFARAAHESREGLLVPTSNVVELVTSSERQPLKASGTDGAAVPAEIDIAKMIRNNERGNDL